MGDSYLVNGYVYSYSSCILKLNGSRYFGFYEISYADKVEEGKGWGASRGFGPRSRTRGKYSADNVKIKFEKKSALLFKADIATLASDGRSYTNPQGWPMSLQLAEDWGTDIVIFQAPRILTGSTSITQSPDPMVEEVEIGIMGYTVNGYSAKDLTQI